MAQELGAIFTLICRWWSRDPQGKENNEETMVLDLSRCAALSPGSDFPPWLLGKMALTD